jgi:hypothetical protein
MTTTVNSISRLYVSGQEVEPGVYYDLQTGAILHMVEPGELPEGARIIRFPRRFYRLPELQEGSPEIPISSAGRVE